LAPNMADILEMHPSVLWGWGGYATVE
jgi:hypothetical protein